MTTPAPVMRAPSVPFECFNNWLCLGGVVAGGVVVILALAYFAIVAANKYKIALAAKKAAAKHEHMEEETEEERAAREALAAEQQAARDFLKHKYKVVPETDPESFAEAKTAYTAVKRVIGSPMQSPFDSLKVDWLKAHVSYWASSEGLKRDTAKKKDVEFCMENNLFELEDDSPKYSEEDLQKKNAAELRKMCRSEEVPFTEPFLFGKKAYFVSLLKEVRPAAGGMREFVSKKLNKLQVVEAAMAYQKERIAHFKNMLEDAKIAAAQREHDDEAKVLETKFKKVEFEKKQAETEAVYAAKRAANEIKREEKKEAKLQRQIGELKMQRAKDKEKAKETSAAAAKKREEEDIQKQRQLEIVQGRAAAEHSADIKAQANAI